MQIIFMILFSSVNLWLFIFRYESKGKQWAKSQPAYPVGMNPALIAGQSAAQNKSKKSDPPLIPGLAPAAQQAAKKKKKKSKPETEVKEVTGKLAGFTIQEPNFGVPTRASKEPSATPVESNSGIAVPSNTSDPAKRLKTLKKKLKDIETLEAKVKSGELKNPDKDQTEKIKRKKEVMKEIKEIENLIK